MPASLAVSIFMTIASSMYQQRQAKKAAAKAKAAEDARKGFEIVVDGDSFPVSIVYGRAKVGGVRVWHSVRANYALPTSNADRIIGSFGTQAVTTRTGFAAFTHPGVATFDVAYPPGIVAQTTTSVSFNTNDIVLYKYVDEGYGSYYQDLRTWTGAGFKIDYAVNSINAQGFNITFYLSSLMASSEDPISVSGMEFHYTTAVSGNAATFTSQYNDFLAYQQVLCYAKIGGVIDYIIDDSFFYNDPAMSVAEQSTSLTGIVPAWAGSLVPSIGMTKGIRAETYNYGGRHHSCITANFTNRNDSVFSKLASAAVIAKLNRDDAQFNGVPNLAFFLEGRVVPQYHVGGGGYFYDSFDRAGVILWDIPVASTSVPGGINWWETYVWGDPPQSSAVQEGGYFKGLPGDWQQLYAESDNLGEIRVIEYSFKKFPGSEPVEWQANRFNIQNYNPTYTGTEIYRIEITLEAYSPGDLTGGLVFELRNLIDGNPMMQYLWVFGSVDYGLVPSWATNYTYFDVDFYDGQEHIVRVEIGASNIALKIDGVLAGNIPHTSVHNGFTDVYWNVEDGAALGYVFMDLTETAVVGTGGGTISGEAYSTNNAMVLLDYLLDDTLGKALDVSEIDIDSFIAGAIICDIPVQEVTVGGKIWQPTDGSRNIQTRTLPLYECNIVLDSSKKVRDNIEAILATTGDARLVWSGGKYKFKLEDPVNPTISATLTDEDFVMDSDVEIAWPSTKDRLNHCTIRYQNEFQNFKEDTVAWPAKMNGQTVKGIGEVIYAATGGHNADGGPGTFLNTYGVWNGTAEYVELKWKVRPAVSGLFQVTMVSDDIGYAYLNGQIFTSSTWPDVINSQVYLSNTETYDLQINCQNTNPGGNRSVGLRILSPQGTEIWTTRFPSYSSLITATYSDELYRQYLAEDNGLELETELYMDGITDYHHALAKAKQIVKVSRTAAVVKFKFVIKDRYFEPGDYVELQSQRLNIGISDTFIVKVDEVNIENNLVCEIRASRWTPEQYAWTIEDEVIDQGVTYQSYLYPIAATDRMAVGSTLLSGSLREGVVRWTEQLDVGSTLLSGARVNVQLFYNYYQAEQFEVNSTLLSGVRTQVQLYYNNYQAEQFDVGSTLLSGARTDVQVYYTTYPAEQLEMGSTLLSGTRSS